MVDSGSIADYAAYAMKVAVDGTYQRDINDDSEEPNTQPETIVKQRRLFFLAMEMSFDGIIMGDLNGNILYVNDAAAEMFAGKRGDFVGKHVLEFVAPAEKQYALDLSLKAIDSGEGYIKQFRVLRNDGTEFVAEVAAAVVKDKGQPIGFIDIVRDITLRKKAEESLKRQAALIDISPSAIIIKTSDEKISFWNNGAEKLYGYKKEEALGRKITKLLKAHYSQPTDEIIAQLQQGENWAGEVTHYTKQGHKVVVHANLLAMLDGMGKIVEVLESYVDITERKRTETRALQKAEDRYLKAERWAAIGQLAGMVGHDLRNPLAGIKNAAYVLRKRQANLGDVGLSMLDTIDKAVEHADAIIMDLLDYSRELHLDMETHSSKSLISYVLLSVKIPSSIQIIERIEDYPLRVDANKVQRVFINLIKNAFEAMPNGGQLKIKSTKIGKDYNFIFSDNGEGMSKEVISKIFTPLFTTKAQGMGLGLAICKRLIEAHGGSIGVQSMKHKGTTFTVSLPA